MHVEVLQTGDVAGHGSVECMMWREIRRALVSEADLLCGHRSRSGRVPQAAGQEDVSRGWRLRDVVAKG